MELETTMAQSLRETDDKAGYDAACKRLLSEKIILAWIMKGCVHEFRACDVNEIAEKYIEGQPQVAETPVEAGTIIHGTGVEDASAVEGTITYDIRFFATAPATGEPIRLIINVEAQNDFYPGYPLIKRAIYYCSRMISAQYGTEFTASHYEKIKKVYSIWICMNPPKTQMNSITSYQIKEDNLVGSVKEPVSNYDLITAVMINLGSRADGGEDDVLRLLSVLLSSEESAAQKRRILEDDFSIRMTESLDKEVSLMCNLSKGVEERGIAKGMEQGMKKGMEKGMEKGLEKGILTSLRGLMASMGLSVDQALSALQVPEVDWQKFRDMLAQ